MSISFVSFIFHYIFSPFTIQQTIVSEILNEIGKVRYTVSITPFFLNRNRSQSTSSNISVKEYKIFNQRTLQKYKEEFNFLLFLINIEIT